MERGFGWKVAPGGAIIIHASQLTEIRYVLLLYAQMACSVLKKIETGSEWIWATGRTPAASDEVQEVSGSTGNDYESPLMGC